MAAKFPPISVFDGVANADALEALYKLQALTNPRLQYEAGKRGHPPIGLERMLLIYFLIVQRLLSPSYS